MNLDPALLDQDKIRLAKRKKYFLAALAPLVLLAFAAIFFLRTAIYNIPVASDNYSTVISFSNIQLIANLIEPYLPFYDRGTAKLAQAQSLADLTSAEADLRTSLKNNPPEGILCSIYGNLSLSLELQGDLKVSDKNYDDALTLYNRAESLLFEHGCASKAEGKTGSDSIAEAAKKRLEEKRKKATDAANGVESEAEGSDEETSKQQISDEDLQKIRDSQSSQDRAAAALRYGIGAGYGASSTHDYSSPNF